MPSNQQSPPDVQPVRDNSTVSHGQPQQHIDQPTAHQHQPELHGFYAGCSESRSYVIKDVIGKGSYGIVFEAYDKRNGKKVAIKKINNVFENVADAIRILREIKLLRLLKHADLVDMLHILLPSDPRKFKDIYVVFELMESDLHTVISANDDLTHDHHKVFLYQLLRGLHFIHDMGVLHRDLKPKNILANSNCKLKICDFGLARPQLGDVHSAVCWTDYVATRWYRAPELCGCFYGCYTEKVDIWSVGCIFAEILLGKALFPGKDAVSQLHLITDLLGKPPQYVIDKISNKKARDFLNNMAPKPPVPLERKFPNADPAAVALLGRLLSFDSDERPTAEEALQDSYFANLPKSELRGLHQVTRDQFEFELHKLTEADVRQLIYEEVLHYHPQVRSVYQANPRGVFHGPQASGAEDMRHMLMLSEQQHYGSAAAAVSAAGRPALQQQLQDHQAAAAAAWYSQHAEQQAAAIQHMASAAAVAAQQQAAAAAVAAQQQAAMQHMVSVAQQAAAATAVAYSQQQGLMMQPGDAQALFMQQYQAALAAYMNQQHAAATGVQVPGMPGV